MTEIRLINSFGHYDSYIQTNFIVDHCGIDLTKLGPKITETVVKVNLDGPVFIDEEQLKAEGRVFVDFVETHYKHPDDRPLWYKINVVDRAINEYLGIGHLNLETNWMKFIVTYLDLDRAEQGGDTMFIIFDTDFKWAVNFTLSQEDSILRIEQFKK